MGPSEGEENCESAVGNSILVVLAVVNSTVCLVSHSVAIVSNGNSTSCVMRFERWGETFSLT